MPEQFALKPDLEGEGQMLACGHVWLLYSAIASQSPVSAVHTAPALTLTTFTGPKALPPSDCVSW